MAVRTEASPAPATSFQMEDLTRIEGIGPKISGILHSAGVTGFAQLAGMESGQLAEIIQDAGIRLADPGTWPEQAALAALGQWEALETLQRELKWGRRV